MTGFLSDRFMPCFINLHRTGFSSLKVNMSAYLASIAFKLGMDWPIDLSSTSVRELSLFLASSGLGLHSLAHATVGSTVSLLKSIFLTYLRRKSRPKIPSSLISGVT